MGAIEKHEISEAHPGSNDASPIYKLYYQLYKLHKIDQCIVATTSLILGGAGFMYSAIPNPL